MQTAAQICLRASRIAKGGSGMVAIAGEFLNDVLEDLKLHRDLKVNRVTQILTVNAGTYGPFTLEADYLRTYDMSYPLQGPNGMTQFLIPITMEQWDAEFKTAATANYPYEFATDLSTQAQDATASATGDAITALTVIPGDNYSSLPAVAFSGGTGTGADATIDNLRLVFGAIAAGGAGYVAGEEVELVGGTNTRATTLVVTAVAAGVVTGLAILEGGAYTILPSGPAATTSTTGTGTGLTVTTLDFGLGEATITVVGSGYTAGETLVATLTGGGGTGGGLLALVGANTPGAGQFYIYPQSNGSIPLTHRYMKNQPDIVNPESSTEIPWFSSTDYLVTATAARMMGITGDERETEFLAIAEKMLQPHMIMEGDEQGTVRSIRLDPRHFKSNRGLRPVKTNPY